MTLQEIQQYNDANIRQQIQDDTISPQVVADALDNIAGFAAAITGPQGSTGPEGPPGASVNYSTTPGGVAQGYNWIDGKPVYKAVHDLQINDPEAFDVGGFPGSGIITAGGEPLYIDTVISFSGWLVSHDDLQDFPGVKFACSINGPLYKLAVIPRRHSDGDTVPCAGYISDGSGLPSPCHLHHLYLVLEFTKP